MWISKKEYNKLINKVYPDGLFSIPYKEQVESLKKQLSEAKDLKLILEKLYPLQSIIGNTLTMVAGTDSYKLNLPDTVLQYTEDILGGKVIKQEGTKCLVVDKEGNVKTGLTKQKADKGYSYKLIRS